MSEDINNLSVEDEPKHHKIRVEMVYRVWKELNVTGENYGHLDSDELPEAAFGYELENDEETFYTNYFEEEIAANGPDDAFILIQLLDPDGNVIKQGTVEGYSHEASVHPQYLVSGMEIEQA